MILGPATLLFRILTKNCLGSLPTLTFFFKTCLPHFCPSSLKSISLKEDHGDSRPSWGLDSEVGFWHALLDPKNGNNSEVDPAAWKSAQYWVESGAFAAEIEWNVLVSCADWVCEHLVAVAGVVAWHYDDICTFLDLARSNEKYGTPRVWHL